MVGLMKCRMERGYGVVDSESRLLQFTHEDVQTSAAELEMCVQVWKPQVALETAQLDMYEQPR